MLKNEMVRLRVGRCDDTRYTRSWAHRVTVKSGGCRLGWQRAWGGRVPKDDFKARANGGRGPITNQQLSHDRCNDFSALSTFFLAVYLIVHPAQFLQSAPRLRSRLSVLHLSPPPSPARPAQSRPKESLATKKLHLISSTHPKDKDTTQWPASPSPPSSSRPSAPPSSTRAAARPSTSASAPSSCSRLLVATR
jgi:hypothetical protein